MRASRSTDDDDQLAVGVALAGQSASASIQPSAGSQKKPKPSLGHISSATASSVNSGRYRRLVEARIAFVRAEG